MANPGYDIKVFREIEGCVWPLNAGGNNACVMRSDTCTRACGRGRRLGCVGESNSSVHTLQGHWLSNIPALQTGD